MAVIEVHALHERYGDTVAPPGGRDAAGGPGHRAGAWPQPVHLVTMVGWTVVATAVAARTFRWE